MRFFYSLLLMLFVHGSSLAHIMPDAYQNFDKKDVIPIKLTAQKSGQQGFTVNGQIIQIPSITNKSGQSKKPQSFQQYFANGEINATIGGGGLYGQLRLDDSRYIITTEKSGMWAVKMPEKANYNSCGTEHNKSINQTLNLKSLSNTAQQKSTGTVIDLLLVYDQAIANRYPGDLLETRVQQYIHVSNQSYANSQLDLSLRLVGLKQAGYNANNANQTLLTHLQQTLAGTASYQGLTEIPVWRAESGADLVIFLRTHDILTRGNCGIAYFPVGNGQQFNPSYGINIMADGSSSWSICTDQLMVHEIGHNLGAGHHNAAPSQRFLPDAAGFARLGQFGTIMGSFGTGDTNRFLELNYFSNPDVQCGGQDCGVHGQRNNVNVMTQLKGPVSQYFSVQSSASYPDPLTPDNTDSDGDGVTNRNDAFPFNAAETFNTDGDPLGDNQDAFPLNPVDWEDFDGDGIGNNIDLDDDNDGHDDRFDDFPFNADEHQDSDEDGIGDNQDEFVNNNMEYIDTDKDGIGDNQDIDSDDDGYPDIDPDKEDILVISVNNNRILRFDAETGRSKGIEVLPNDGHLTFQSDMVYDDQAQRLIYTTESRVKSHDLRDQDQPVVTLIYPYHDDKTELNSGFPSALALNQNQKLTVAKTRTTSDSFELQDYMSEFSLPLRGQAHYLNRKYITVKEETLVDFTYDNNQLYALGANQPLYQGADNHNQLSVLGGSAQSWLKGSYAIMATNSGDIVSTKNGQIFKTDGTTGEFIELLASPFALGYNHLRGISQTKDQRLLVADAEANAILQFNMSGEFLGELVSDHGLDGPHKIITVPALQDRLYQNPDRVISPNSGNWFNPASSGRGFTVAIFNKRLQVLWFTYDQDGLPIWYFSADILDGFHYQSGLLKTTQISDSEVEFELVGEIEVNFHNEREATVSWQLHDESGSEHIEWQQFSYEPEQINYTGMWTREDAPGWGTAIATIGEKSVITPYLYDGAGEPRWLSSDIAFGTSPLHFNLGFFTSQTLCPGCSGEPSVEFQKVGEMTFDFETNTWQSDISWPSPLFGAWPLENTAIIRISDEPRSPR
jgi:hypothetical protein